MAQLKMIRERFLANARQHLLVSCTASEKHPCRCDQTNRASRASETSESHGKIEA